MGLLLSWRVSGSKILSLLIIPNTLSIRMAYIDSLVGSVSQAASLGTFLQPSLTPFLDHAYSHVNSEVPGCIHEGGELGYALSVSFGAIMDRPDLIVACVVGDGEAETGPMATSVKFKYIY